MMNICFIFTAVILQVTLANKLPAYIDRCKISDPKFDDCVLKSARRALQPILKGDAEFGFPKLFPFTIPTIAFDLSENVHFNLTNVRADISNDAMFTDVHFDFDRKTITLSAKVSLHTWFVDYESSGQLAGKPFQETGKANITFDNISENVTLNFGFKMVDGKKYIEALSGETKTSSERFVFKPYNQVAGGAPMTDEQLQEYRPYFKTIGLAIRERVQQLATPLYVSFLNVAFKAQPFNEIFLP